MYDVLHKIDMTDLSQREIPVLRDVDTIRSVDGENVLIM